MNETDTTMDACVWRLFDTSLIDITNMDYHLYIFMHTLTNCDLYLVVQEMPQEVNNEWVLDVSNF